MLEGVLRKNTLLQFFKQEQIAFITGRNGGKRDLSALMQCFQRNNSIKYLIKFSFFSLSKCFGFIVCIMQRTN